MGRAGFVPPWDPRAVAGMEMHQCQCPAWELPCPMPGAGTGGQRRHLARAAMEPGTVSSSQPGTMGSIVKGALGQGSLAGGLSRVKAAGCALAHPGSSPGCGRANRPQGNLGCCRQLAGAGGTHGAGTRAASCF